MREPLWPHQLEVARSSARYRVICAGRRSGKTRLFGVLALHQTFSVSGSRVLIVSAGEVAAKRMFADIAGMAVRAPLLAGSIADETKSMLTLTNGSSIECVPASMAQVRSAEADLLIVDEGGFVPQSIWEAAEPTVVARPGSRVLICSTPWGSAEHFFRVLWQQGMTRPDGQVESWHWPSTVSPLVDEALLDEIAGRSTAEYFAREYLAKWTDDAGSYFTEAELTASAGGFDLVDPADVLTLGPVVGGVDWGYANDANTLVVVAGLPEPDALGRKRFRVPYLEEAFRRPYADWIERVVEVSAPAGGGAGFTWQQLTVETNAVGAMPSQVLAKRMADVGLPSVVVPVTTTARLKEDTFGYVKLLLQQGRLELPNEPALLKQLRALQFEQLPAGGTRIAVPERAGHDDLAMGLALAMLPVMSNDLPPAPDGRLLGLEDFLDDDEWSTYSISRY